MSNTLLPSNEPLTMQQKDIAYRNAIPSHSAKIDFNPMTCDASLLPYLAQCWQVLYWDEAWSELEKRRFVRDTREVHRHIGTPYAIEKVFEAISIEARIVEWFEMGDTLLDEVDNKEPYTFYVTVDVSNMFLNISREIDLVTQKKLFQYINTYKNVRSQFEIYYAIKTEQQLAIGSIANTTSLNNIEASTDPKQEFNNDMTIGAISTSSTINNVEAKTQIKGVTIMQNLVASVSITEVLNV